MTSNDYNNLKDILERSGLKLSYSEYYMDNESYFLTDSCIYIKLKEGSLLIFEFENGKCANYSSIKEKEL